MREKCEHCEGTGRCGADNCWGASCNTCAEKSGFQTAFWRTNPTVVCSVCNGKGYHMEDAYGPLPSFTPKFKRPSF